jgi:hypothetical protein
MWLRVEVLRIGWFIIETKNYNGYATQQFFQPGYNNTL